MLSEMMMENVMVELNEEYGFDYNESVNIFYYLNHKRSEDLYVMFEDGVLYFRVMNRKIEIDFRVIRDEEDYEGMIKLIKFYKS